MCTLGKTSSISLVCSFLQDPYNLCAHDSFSTVACIVYCDDSSSPHTKALRRLQHPKGISTAQKKTTYLLQLGVGWLQICRQSRAWPHMVELQLGSCILQVCEAYSLK